MPSDRNRRRNKGQRSKETAGNGEQHANKAKDTNGDVSGQRVKVVAHMRRVDPRGQADQMQPAGGTRKDGQRPTDRKTSATKSTSANRRVQQKSVDASDRRKQTIRNFQHYDHVLLIVTAILTAVVLSKTGWVMPSPAVNVRSLQRPLLHTPVLHNTQRQNDFLWGSYRPQVYFGLRPRLPRSIVAGLMWLEHYPSNRRDVSVRHLCRHEDGLVKYGWTHHDGHSFGIQEIVERAYTIQTAFIKGSGKNGGSWTAKISGQKTQQLGPPTFVLMFYLSSEDGRKLIPVLKGGSKTQIQRIDGYLPQLGQYSLHLPSDFKNSSYFIASGIPLHKLVDVTNEIFWKFGKLSRHGFEVPGKDSEPYTVVYQVSTSFPFSYEFTFAQAESHPGEGAPSGLRFDEEIHSKKAEFSQRFDKIFQLKSKGYQDSEVSFAQSVFSNLIGSIGYFHGDHLVTAEHIEKQKSYGPFDLYTAVPSRAFFPRGFLWDEGFHQLVIQRWNINITMDILAHWLDTMNIDGWIPREQILGPEARSRVPEEFLVQHAEHANPPTFFLTIQSMLRRIGQSKEQLEFLRSAYPRLEEWFSWYSTTQIGEVATAYRWDGRSYVEHVGSRAVKSNAATLMSGLDDYPRASHPSNSERHLDLRCWMALASGVMMDISNTLNISDDTYKAVNDKLTNNQLLEKLHWSESNKTFCDYGVHQSRPKSKPKKDFVPEFGYVSLFPLFMRILKADSTKLAILLEQLRNPKLLWTDYGLRALARTSAFYKKKNSPQDPAYWRGAIWINMNYLSLRALHFYGNTPGPYRDKCLRLYGDLRKNVVGNIYRQYTRTGYIWENYNDRDGSGQGTHPFTGWSSLVVLIMAEEYD